jgi:signal peptidase I
VDIRRVNTEDMLPFLSRSNIVIIDKASGLFIKPDRKDVVLVQNPLKPKEDRNLLPALKPDFKMLDGYYILRISAKEGDTIEIDSKNNLLLNNSPLPEPYLADKGNGYICQVAKHCKRTQIKNDSYYLLGDNRNTSQDSRIWSEIHKTYLKGKIAAIIWPLKDFKVF